MGLPGSVALGKPVTQPLWVLSPYLCISCPRRHREGMQGGAGCGGWSVIPVETPDPQLLFSLSLSLFLTLGLLPRHMEVPRLGVKSTLQPQPQPHGIQAESAPYTTGHGQAESLTPE